MKTTINLQKTLVAAVVALFLTFVVALTLNAQDKNDSQKKARIVMKINKGGKSNMVTIDTAFDLSDAKDLKEFELFMKDHGKQGDELEKKMKEIEVSVNIPDSIGMDSIIKKVIIIGDKMGKCNGMMMQPGNDCNFQFEMPGCHEAMDCCKKMGLRGFPAMDCSEKEGTLSDLIGDIPLERVKSYSIKNHKNGKRIIIDVENAPFFEKRVCKKMMIEGEPDAKNEFFYQNSPGHKVEKRVIIRTDDDEKPEKEKK